MASKSWYPHEINTDENLNSIASKTDVSYYGVNQMGDEEGREFLTCYDDTRISEETFDNRSVLQNDSQDYVTVLRQASRVYRC